GRCCCGSAVNSLEEKRMASERLLAVSRSAPIQQSWTVGSDVKQFFIVKGVPILFESCPASLRDFVELLPDEILSDISLIHENMCNVRVFARGEALKFFDTDDDGIYRPKDFWQEQVAEFCRATWIVPLFIKDFENDVTWPMNYNE